MDAFLWEKKPSILASNSWRNRMRPKNRNRLALEVYQRCLFHRAPDKESLCCTCIMNAKMRFQMHNEDDFIYPIFPPFNKHLQKQPNAGEELWENRQLSSQACNLASIDSALYIPHGHTHTHANGNIQTAPKNREHTRRLQKIWDDFLPD